VKLFIRLELMARGAIDPEQTFRWFSGGLTQRDAAAATCGSKQMRLLSTVVVVCTVLAVHLTYAQTTDTSVVKFPQDIQFKGPLVGPSQTVVLYGDPANPGVFVTRVRFSTGWKDMPHRHPDEVRTVVVLSGTFYFASGEKWDESKFKAYPAGTFYSEPPKAPHYTWAKDGEVIIQVTGIGPYMPIKLTDA